MYKESTRKAAAEATAPAKSKEGKEGCDRSWVAVKELNLDHYIGETP